VAGGGPHEVLSSYTWICRSRPTGSRPARRGPALSFLARWAARPSATWSSDGFGTWFVIESTVFPKVPCLWYERYPLPPAGSTPSWVLILTVRSPV